MTPWNRLVLSLATSSTQTISPSPTVMSLNTWDGAQGRQLPTTKPTAWLPGSISCRPPAHWHHGCRGWGTAPTSRSQGLRFKSWLCHQ